MCIRDRVKPPRRDKGPEATRPSQPQTVSRNLRNEERRKKSPCVPSTKGRTGSGTTGIRSHASPIWPTGSKVGTPKSTGRRIVTGKEASGSPRVTLVEAARRALGREA
eukprot:12328224-Heterocapsa_arctica.AAC.1